MSDLFDRVTAHNAVIRAIKAIEPEAKVAVNLEAGTISVEGIDADDSIGQAVKEAGFGFDGSV